MVQFGGLVVMAAVARRETAAMCSKQKTERTTAVIVQKMFSQASARPSGRVGQLQNGSQTSPHHARKGHLHMLYQRSPIKQSVDFMPSRRTVGSDRSQEMG